MAKTILVVDDEALIAMDIQSQLEDLGHKVLTASDLAEAIAIVRRVSVDLAVVDWHLRNEVSAPLIDLLKERQIRFVVCSGSALEELVALFPASPILTKPYTADDLVTVLNRLIDDGESLH